MVLNLLRHHHHDKYMCQLQYIVSHISWMKSGGAHVSTSCYLNPGLLYTMHTFKFHMILMHDQQNPLTTSNYILHAPKPSCNIQQARERELSREIEREKERQKEIDIEIQKTRRKMVHQPTNLPCCNMCTQISKPNISLPLLVSLLHGFSLDVIYNFA